MQIYRKCNKVYKCMHVAIQMFLVGTGMSNSDRRDSLQTPGAHDVPDGEVQSELIGGSTLPNQGYVS